MRGYFYAMDLLATGGLDDRLDRGKVLQRAQDLMAEAVGAEVAWFSTCGSSLSVKAAMMATRHSRNLCGGMKVSGTPGFVRGGSGNITDR